MNSDELVLSDVHLSTFARPSTTDNQLVNATTRFVFSCPVHCNHDGDGNAEHLPETDSDGDFVLDRSSSSTRNNEKDVIVLNHSLATSLSNVGLQVWRGALLLADYIVSHNSMFDGCVAMEMGAGAGLVSVVIGMFAEHVFCTDTGDNVLENCETNVHNNGYMYRNRSPENPVVVVKEFDWLADGFSTDAGRRFSWTCQEIQLLDSVTVFLAADVVYRDELTDAFFMKMYDLLSKPPAKSLYISIEKRLNFTLEELDVACPEYEYFRACLDRFGELESSDCSFSVEQIPSNFHQHFRYERVKQLELWRITSAFSNG